MSFSPVTYQDLETCGINFTQVFFACRALDKKRNVKYPIQSVESIYQWKNQGIPRRFLYLVSNQVSNFIRRSSDKSALAAVISSQVDIFANTEKNNENNNLDDKLSSFSPPLVTVAFSQSTIETEFSSFWLRCYVDSFVIAEKSLIGIALVPYWQSAAALMPFSQEKQKERFISRSRARDFANLDFYLLDFIESEIKFMVQLFSFYACSTLLTRALLKEYRKNDKLKGYFARLKPFDPPKVAEKDLPDFLVRYRYALHDTARKLLPYSRTSACTHIALGKESNDFPTALANDSSGVTLKYHPEFSSTSFSGLQTCASPWSCPICAPKISDFRGGELSYAINEHTLESKEFRKILGKKSGQFLTDLFSNQAYLLKDFGVTSFVTRTIPHSASDSLEYVLDTFQAADAKLKQHRQYKQLMHEYGVLGSVKVFELTVGRNGWHLHVHEIYFHDSEKRCMLSSGEVTGGESWYDVFRFHMWLIWKNAAMAAGFDAPSFKHGLQVQNGDFAAEYAAKFGREPSNDFWSVDKEMSKYHLKKSRSGLSPFDLLRQYQATHEQMYADLFIEYSFVMKGARQMMWSRGLKDYFEVKDKTDEEIAAEDMDVVAFPLGEFTKLEWSIVCAHSFKADVLLIGKYHGFLAVQNFLKKFA